jgi:hypothetical protein
MPRNLATIFITRLVRISVVNEPLLFEKELHGWNGAGKDEDVILDTKFTTRKQTEDNNCDCSVLSRNQVKLGINSNDKNIQIMSNLCDPFAFAHVAIHVVVLDNFIMTALVISR